MLHARGARWAALVCVTACSLGGALAIRSRPSGPDGLGAPRHGGLGLRRANAPAEGLWRPENGKRKAVRGGGDSDAAIRGRVVSVGIEALRGGVEGDVAISGLVISLVKNIVGSGMLALPAGIAAFSDQRKVVPLAVALAGSAAAFAGYCFSLVGKVCLQTGAKSYAEAWERTIGRQTVWLPTLFVASNTFIACLCYSIIIADLLRDLAASQGLTGLLANRDLLLTLLTGTVLLPLCLLRSFAALQFTSVLGIVGTFASIGHMAYRWLDGTYAPGGAMYKRMPDLEKPTFDGKGTSLLKSLILISTLTSSYFAHYNAPKFLSEITGGDRLKTFNRVVTYGFGGAFLLNALTMATGFLTFGGASQGLILNSYAGADKLANVARIGVLLSVIFGFPHSYVGLRDGVLPALGRTSQHDKDIFAFATLIILTYIAEELHDLGVVVALFGALLGSSIIFVFPALMAIAHRRKEVAEEKSGSVAYGQEYYINVGIGVFGALLGALGVVIVLLQNFTDVLR